MDGVSSHGGTGGNHAPIIGLIVGISAALPMYLWQSRVQVAVASFVMFGYTGWLWASTRLTDVFDPSMRSTLRRMEVNRLWRRTGRLMLDPGFWWSVLFGGAMMAGSLWYVGLKDPHLMTQLIAAWLMIATCLNFGLTLHHPTTRCRRCGYQLLSHMNRVGPHDPIVCPECGATWTAARLCFLDPPPTQDRGDAGAKAA